MSYENIKFVSFDDFCKNRKVIRFYYRELLLRDKIAFKRYVYDDLKMCESDKNVIWNFLNENENCKKELQQRIYYKNTLKKKKMLKQNMLLNIKFNLNLKD